MKRKPWQMRSVVLGAAVLLSLLFLLSVSPDIYSEESTEPCLAPFINTIHPSTAKPGDQVRIRGRRFTRQQGEVIFSPDAKAEIVTWKNSRIWVVVPRSTATGPVIVSIPCGAVSNKKHFTVKK